MARPASSRTSVLSARSGAANCTVWERSRRARSRRSHQRDRTSARFSGRGIVTAAAVQRQCRPPGPRMQTSVNTTAISSLFASTCNASLGFAVSTTRKPAIRSSCAIIVRISTSSSTTSTAGRDRRPAGTDRCVAAVIWCPAFSGRKQMRGPCAGFRWRRPHRRGTPLLWIDEPNAWCARLDELKDPRPNVRRTTLTPVLSPDRRASVARADSINPSRLRS